MLCFNRIMRIMKSFVMNRSPPEGSIAESYIGLECLTFCYRYLHDITRQEGSLEGEVLELENGGLTIFRTIGNP